MNRDALRIISEIHSLKAFVCYFMIHGEESLSWLVYGD